MPLLSWHNRDDDLTRAARAPYRLLEPVAGLSYGDADSPNMLIEGDNLDALKALLPYYAGQVKCVFIDPPYNTGSAFEHYDDNIEHSQWLSMMYPRLELLRQLLSEDGTLWVTLDDNEAHYFKVICDEVFGRPNFVTSIAWQKFHSVKKNSKYGISTAHDHIFVYRKGPKLRDFNLLDMDEEALKVYKNPDKDPRGLWRTAPLTVSLLGGARGEAFARTGVSTGFYEITAPNGTRHLPNKGRCWISRRGFEELLADNRIWWGKDGNAVPMKKVFVAESGGKKIASTFWPHAEVGSNKTANEEQRALLGDGDAFATPKPERLLHRIIHLATSPGDLVLDSFLGSGTTAAVAHKMGRRWIGIETGKHARTHCQPRLRQVVEGESGGISEAVGWNGGGGFRFFKLGKAVFDENGRIDADIRFEHLAAHVWFAETGTPRSTRAGKHAFLGEHHGTGYYLLFNGILGDDGRAGGNVLTRRVLRSLPPFDGPKVIFGEACALPEEQLHELGIRFRQTPYDIRAR